MSPATSLFFYCVLEEGMGGKGQSWRFRVLFLAERIVSEDSVVSSNRIVNVGAHKAAKQINMLVIFEKH